jgi:NADP-dependent 3-hydroxy acid dehydrogenase YdfG
MKHRKNIFITGAKAGIGLQTARALYGDGHSIIFESKK